MKATANWWLPKQLSSNFREGVLNSTFLHSTRAEPSHLPAAEPLLLMKRRKLILYKSTAAVRCCRPEEHYAGQVVGFSTAEDMVMNLFAARSY